MSVNLRSSKTARRLLGAAAVGIAATMVAQQAHAANLSLAYDFVQTSTNATFNAGTGTVTTISVPANQQMTITLSSTTKYFRFGIDATVSNSANPVSGDAWDVWNQNWGQNNNGNPEDASLGASGIIFNVQTSSGLNTNLTPVANKVSFSATPSGQSTVPTYGFGSSTFYQSTYPGGSSGNVLAVGSASSLVGGGDWDANGQSLINQFTSKSTLFTNLTYQITTGVTNATETVQPTIIPGDLSFFYDKSLGAAGSADGSVPGTEPTYGYARDYTGGTDSYTDLPAITVQIGTGGSTPEPASLGLIGGISALLLSRRRARKA